MLRVVRDAFRPRATVSDTARTRTCERLPQALGRRRLRKNQKLHVDLSQLPRPPSRPIVRRARYGRVEAPR